MGAVVSYLKKPKKILILGPRYAGKTTVFEYIATSNKIKPKIDQKSHFNFLKLRGFNIWDLRGQKCLQEFWSCYYDNTAGIIFVVDYENEDESLRKLKEVSLARELRNVVLLVIANKLSVEISEKKIKSRIQKVLKRKAFNFLAVKKDSDFSDIKNSFDSLVTSISEKRK